MKVPIEAIRRKVEDLDPELSLYRQHTVGLLRRYFRMSMELGRLPSVLGREFFRARVTSYRMQSFEDVVILVYDVEKCIAGLDAFSQQLIARIVLQEHSQQEAAELLGCTRRTVVRRLPQALDLLTEKFFATGLLRRTGGSPATQCQAGDEEDFAATA